MTRTAKYEDLTLSIEYGYALFMAFILIVLHKYCILLRRLNSEYLRNTEVRNKTWYRQSETAFGTTMGPLYGSRLLWTFVHKRRKIKPEFLHTLLPAPVPRFAHGGQRTELSQTLLNDSGKSLTECCTNVGVHPPKNWEQKLSTFGRLSTTSRLPCQ